MPRKNWVPSRRVQIAYAQVKARFIELYNEGETMDNREACYKVIEQELGYTPNTIKDIVNVKDALAVRETSQSTAA